MIYLPSWVREVNSPPVEPVRLPTLDIAGWLGWRAKYNQIIFDEPPFLMLQMTPMFPYCHPALAERCIVWDVFSLIESIKRPGAHQLLTCECGYAPDAEIEESVLVSHPDEHTVVWEFDSQGLRATLDDSLVCEDGFYRWTFDRADYERDIRALLREVQARITQPVAVTDLSDTYGLDHLINSFPDIKTLRVEEFEPDTRGMAAERLLEIDPDAAWPREPLWPSGTVLEFGFFKDKYGHDWLMIDGQVKRACWPGHYFTRWQAVDAFNAWVATTERGHSLPTGSCTPEEDVNHQNTRFLRQESDRDVCHAAGRRLAQVLQHGYQEGSTAPGVMVRYQASPLTVI